MPSLPRTDLALWHDTAFAVLSAPAIYKWLFSGILSPLGDSVLDKRILPKFVRFATVPTPQGVFRLHGRALSLGLNMVECKGVVP